MDEQQLSGADVFHLSLKWQIKRCNGSDSLVERQVICNNTILSIQSVEMLLLNWQAIHQNAPKTPYGIMGVYREWRAHEEGEKA